MKRYGINYLFAEELMMLANNDSELIDKAMTYYPDSRARSFIINYRLFKLEIGKQ